MRDEFHRFCDLVDVLYGSADDTGCSGDITVVDSEALERLRVEYERLCKLPLTDRHHRSVLTRTRILLDSASSEGCAEDLTVVDLGALESLLNQKYAMVDRQKSEGGENP